MLNSESIKKIDAEVKKYPSNQRQSAVMSALAIAQDEKGWLTNEIMDFVAHYLGMPSIAVYEVATFYNMYNLKPTGKYKITVCTNLPCSLSGGNDAADYLKQKLGINFNQITDNAQFALKEGECMGACGDAPVLLINNKRMCSFMSQEKIDRLLEELNK